MEDSLREELTNSILPQFSLPEDLQLKSMDLENVHPLEVKIKSNHGSYLLFAQEYNESLKSVESYIKFVEKATSGHFIKVKYAAKNYPEDMRPYALSWAYSDVFLYQIEVS